MEFFEIILIVATLLCSLVAGFLFAFAVVVMPGIGKLDSRGFVRAFQVIDGVIQGNQPLFIFVWLGSIIALPTAILISFSELNVAGRVIACVAGVVYFLGVQGPTVAVNIPLNNQLQKIDLDSIDDTALQSAREQFESTWNRWNVIRAVLASVAVGLLLILLAGNYTAQGS